MGSAGAGAYVQTRGLTRCFGPLTAVESIDLDIAAGEIVALIGPNGGGKSTLLLLIAGLLRPTRGTASVGGVPAHQLALAQTGSVGLITARPGLYPLLSGRENLHFFGRLNGLSLEQIDRRSAPLLEELGLPHGLDAPVSRYSSGMQQKLSLVRALLLEPRILLLDEPTSNLDPLSAHALHVAVRSRADRGMAVVLATHDLPSAEGISDRAVLVRRRVLSVLTLEGAREAPPVGRLFEAYRAELET